MVDGGKVLSGPGLQIFEESEWPCWKSLADANAMVREGLGEGAGTRPGVALRTCGWHRENRRGIWAWIAWRPIRYPDLTVERDPPGYLP